MNLCNLTASFYLRSNFTFLLKLETRVGSSCLICVFIWAHLFSPFLLLISSGGVIWPRETSKFKLTARESTAAYMMSIQPLKVALETKKHQIITILPLTVGVVAKSIWKAQDDSWEQDEIRKCNYNNFSSILAVLLMKSERDCELLFFCFFVCQVCSEFLCTPSQRRHPAYFLHLSEYLNKRYLKAAFPFWQKISRERKSPSAMKTPPQFFLNERSTRPFMDFLPQQGGSRWLRLKKGEERRKNRWQKGRRGKKDADVR